MGSGEEGQAERVRGLLNQLWQERSLDPLQQLFWSELNYEKVNSPIPRRAWSKTANEALSEDPRVFASAGKENDFKVICSHLNSDKLLLGLERPVIKKLIAEARKQGLKVVGSHVEGMERRAQGAAPGDNSDEQSIDAVCPQSDVMIVRKDGDEDKRFTTISTGKKIPLVMFEKNMELSDVLKNLYQK